MGFITERLQVRRLTMRDLESFHELWSDPNVIRWGATSEDLEASRTRLHDFIKQRLDGIDESGWFAVERRDDGRFVGDVLLGPAPWDGELAEVGWHLAAAWQGRGYATEAAAGLLVHAKQRGVDKVYATILPDNHASQGVARRIGMKIAGRVDLPLGLHDLWERDLGTAPM